ncbi:sensor histidine kinase [Paenibacillus chitinolyticus]|uniref:cache domain-containing sensor histidine kinase n=1 Tax=Paenibacillus chitinolyticus TaxID=79263 RepID=UPI003558607B
MIKWNLSRKIFLYLLSIILITLTSVGIFTYKKASDELDKQNRLHMNQILTNALHHTDVYVKSYDRLTISLLTNRDIKKFVDLPPVPEPYDYYKFWSTIRETALQPIFIRNPEIVSMYAISFAGNGIYGYSNDQAEGTYPREQTLGQLERLKNVTEPDGTLSITTDSIVPAMNGNVIRLSRQIKGLQSAEYKGILAVEIRSNDLSMLWKGIDLGEGGYFFIVNDKGEMIYQPSKDGVGPQALPELLPRIVHSGETASFEHKGPGGEERLYMSRKSSYSGWNLVVSMPLSELKKPVTAIRTTTILIGLFTLAIAVALAYRFGRSITRPILVLIQGMRQTEQGKWSTVPLPNRRDEITELMQRYNLMVGRLSELVEQVYEGELKQQKTQLERQQAEFQALQLQINPHFLYNTLETIVCYAVVQDSEEISEIVKSMAYMLRYSVQTNLEEITVANELNHVLNYMIILKHRQDREFELDVAVPPQFLLKKMVRLTLQPLIENVFQHAFPDGLEDHHWIRIDAGEESGMFWISVEDNGTGMTRETLENLQSKLKTQQLTDASAAEGLEESGRGGIGVLNVHRRIQLVFGAEFGLCVESEPGIGTKMTMIMPVSKPANGSPDEGRGELPEPRNAWRPEPGDKEGTGRTE